MWTSSRRRSKNFNYKIANPKALSIFISIWFFFLCATYEHIRENFSSHNLLYSSSAKSCEILPSVSIQNLVRFFLSKIIIIKGKITNRCKCFDRGLNLTIEQLGWKFFIRIEGREFYGKRNIDYSWIIGIISYR